jgi:hypothetical protein
MRCMPLRLAAPVLALYAAATVGTALAQPQTVTVPLGAGRDEQDVNGTATLTDLGDGTTRVVIRVNPANPDMLAHIHSAACPGAGPVLFPLTDVTNGTSTTVVDAPLATVLAQGQSINLHKSPDQVDIYVSCGNFAAALAAGSAPPPAQAPAQVPRAQPGTGEAG